MSDRVVVVNVANGAWFPRGQKRLGESLQGYDIVFTGWSDCYPDGCETHQAKPYQFKRKALEWARDQDYDIAIWADASCWFVKDPQPLIDVIRERGYWICTLGWDIGSWCSDKALIGTNYTRDELFKMPMTAATFYAIDFRKPIAGKLLDYMRMKEQYFPGPYQNIDGEASTDKRVGGHRHDQTFLSVFAHEHDMIIDRPPCFFEYAKQFTAWQRVPARRMTVLLR